MVEVDSFVINFGTFMPGKLLGSTLLIKNRSRQEQVLHLTINHASEIIDVGAYREDARYGMFRDYCESGEIVRGKSSKGLSEVQLANSESAYKCWFLEDPGTKDLVKKITLRLGAECQQEFIVVVRAPSTPKPDSLLSFIDLDLATHEHTPQLLEEVQKRPGREHYSFSDLEELGRLKVMIMGKIDPPKIFCPRILTETQEGQKIIPVALKRQGGCQKFRVPFRNEGSQDAEVEFSFIKVGENPEVLAENEFSMNEVLEFYCMPGTLKIAKDTNQILSMLIKVNMDKMREFERRGLVVKNSLLKLLLGKVKDSQVLYSFYVDVKFAV